MAPREPAPRDPAPSDLLAGALASLLAQPVVFAFVDSLTRSADGAPSRGALALLGLGGVAALSAVAWRWARSANAVARRAAFAFALAAAVLGAASVRDAAAPTDWDTFLSQSEAGWAAVWTDLETTAERVASELDGELDDILAAAPDTAFDPASDPAVALELFERLASAAEVGLEGDAPRPTLLLFDADGEARAWAGPGLLHEPEGWELEGGDTSAFGGDTTDGRGWRRGFTAVTLYASRTLGSARRPWRLVAGRSLPLEPFPFASIEGDSSSETSGETRPGWTVGLASDGSLDVTAPSAGTETAASPPGAPLDAAGPQEIVDAGGEPALFLDRTVFARRALESSSATDDPLRPWPATLGALALVLFGAARLWSGSSNPGGSSDPELAPSSAPSGLSALAALVGLGLFAMAWSAPPAAVGMLLGGAASLFLAFLLPPARHRSTSPGEGEGSSLASPILRGIGIAGTLTLVAFAAHRFARPPDLTVPLEEGLGAWMLSAGWLLVALGSWALGGGSRARETSETSARQRLRFGGRDTAAWGSLVAIVGGASLLDHTAAALACCLLSGAGLGVWVRSIASVRQRDLEARRRPLTLMALAILVALQASLAWQIAARQAQRDEAMAWVDRVAPPTAEERRALGDALRDHFTALDLHAHLPPAGRGIDDRDLAYRLWRASPLPRRDALSALQIDTESRSDSLDPAAPADRPTGEDGSAGLAIEPAPSAASLGPLRSRFSFGLALGDAAESDPEDPLAFDPLALGADTRWESPRAPIWREALLSGQVDLPPPAPAGSVLRYWLLPRPGFRLGGSELDELEAYLVRGGPRAGALDGLPDDLRLGLYDREGRPFAAPGANAPALPPSVIANGAGTITTDSGPERVWLREDYGTVTAIFQPRLAPRDGVERVLLQALPSLAPLAAMASLVALLLAGLNFPLRLARRALRSYSRRLILVFLLLLALPLVALDLIVLEGAAERLEEDQLADARRAIAAARSLLVERLARIEPGVALETQIDRALMERIARLVDHQVNLYWGSRLYASSQQELFTAGLLPRRIPGEIYTKLSLRGAETTLRTQRARDLAYLEIYTGVDIPGVLPSQQALFLSVPLLAREEDTARELASLRRRTLLVSGALVLLLAAIGARLSRSFTRPILELIEDTRRIAADEPTSHVAPRDEELSALAGAIDVMAQRVGESRQRLVSEKEFVERVVANIASGVVSIDRSGRISAQNAVAAEMLGGSAGEPLEDALARRRDLRPLVAFLARARAGGVRTAEQVKLRPVGERVDVLEWTLTWVPVPGGEDPVELLVVDDSTEVLRGQRLEAWAEMARIIAHEIKNPLTPIRLSTEHLQQVWRQAPERVGEVIDRCADNILLHVEELRQIASEFSIYSRIPHTTLAEDDLAEAMRSLVGAYRDAAQSGPGSAGVTFAYRGLDTLRAHFDARLLGRAVRNLLENALRAAGDAGTVTVSVESTAGTDADVPEAAIIEVADTGPGVDPHKLDRIFEPYFSTHESGTGLGLAIVQRIVTEHGGTIEARNRPGGGLAMVITIPIRPPAPARPSSASGPPSRDLDTREMPT